jgi:hypothetical protein
MTCNGPRLVFSLSPGTLSSGWMAPDIRGHDDFHEEQILFDDQFRFPEIPGILSAVSVQEFHGCFNDELARTDWYVPDDDFGQHHGQSKRV